LALFEFLPGLRTFARARRIPCEHVHFMVALERAQDTLYCRRDVDLTPFAALLDKANLARREIHLRPSDKAFLQAQSRQHGEFPQRCEVGAFGLFEFYRFAWCDYPRGTLLFLHLTLEELAECDRRVVQGLTMVVAHEEKHAP